MSSPTDHNHGHVDNHGPAAHAESSVMESGIPLVLLIVVLAAAAMFYSSSNFPPVAGAAHGASAEHGEAKH